MALTNGPNLGVLVDGEQGEAHYSALMARWRALDALIQPNALSATTAAQPGSPDDGDTYLVPTGATGADWAGQDGAIARYSTVAEAWEFFTPREGWAIYVQDGDALWIYSGTEWIESLKLAEYESTRRYVGTVQTADDTPTTLLTIPVPSGAAVMIETNVIGKTATPDATSFRQTATFKNTAGTVTQIGATTSVHAHPDTALVSADVTYTPSGANILVQVEGVAATNINWVGRVIVTLNN